MRASFVRAADFSLLVKILFLWFFILLCKYGSVWSVLEGRLIFFFLPNILDSLGINARRKISKNLKHSVAVLKRSEHRIYTANNKKFKVLTRTARRRWWWRRRSNGSRRTRSLRRLMAATGLCNSGSPTNPFLLFSRGGPHKKMHETAARGHGSLTTMMGLCFSALLIVGWYALVCNLGLTFKIIKSGRLKSYRKL